MKAHLHHAVARELADTLGHSQTASWKAKLLNMEFRALATTSAVGLALGVANVGGPEFSGLCLGFGSILFGLSFIVKAVQMAEQAAAAPR